MHEGVRCKTVFVLRKCNTFYIKILLSYTSVNATKSGKTAKKTSGKGLLFNNILVILIRHKFIHVYL